MNAQLGLRERKKRETRQLIAQTARRLFLERGFDDVTVDEVAREADVSRMTVFNHFPTKEDLFYSRMEAFEEGLLDAIRSRRPGESILAAFARFVTESRGMLASGDPDAGEKLYALTKLITSSPALLDRERRVLEGYTVALAELIAEETDARPGDVAPWVAANAMIGLHRALIDYVRREVLAGERDTALILRKVRAQARQAVALLEKGLGQLAGAAHA